MSPIRACRADATKPAPTAMRLDSVMLTFSDATFESQYTAERFAAAFMPFVAMCGVMLAMSVMLAVSCPEMVYLREPAAVMIVFFALRLWYHRMTDQHRARILACAMSTRRGRPRL